MAGCSGCRKRAKKPLGQKKAEENKPVSRQPTTAKMRQSFTLITRDNRTMTFGSRLEAEAERVRAGGGTIR